jgi:hypothetical protein
MNAYRVLAQSFTTSQRITKDIAAIDEAQALRVATKDLDTLSAFYIVSITAVETAASHKG